MRRLRQYLGAVALVLLLGGAAVLLAVAGNSPAEKVTSRGGEQYEVTPVDRMRVRTAEKAPGVDADGYRLETGGLVEKPYSLSLEELRALPAEERFVPLPCVEGWTERAVWTGARLAEVLERAKTLESADAVVFSSPGGYTTSLTLDDVAATDPLLAYEVNGEALPEDQGFPVRLVVPDRLGYKWIKWVTGIEVIEGEYSGYWESRGYDNEADATGR